MMQQCDDGVDVPLTDIAAIPGDGAVVRVRDGQAVVEASAGAPL